MAREITSALRIGGVYDTFTVVKWSRRLSKWGQPPAPGYGMVPAWKNTPFCAF